MRDDAALRKHLVELLQGGHAHATFDQAFANLPAKLRGATVPNCPFTPWRLLEHMRITQWDILEFSRNPKHTSPEWPRGYWPAQDAPPDAAAWDRSLGTIREDLATMQELVKDPATDLFAPIPGGDGQTILREAMLMADHNAYHVGQVILLRRLLGAWQEK